MSAAPPAIIIAAFLIGGRYTIDSINDNAAGYGAITDRFTGETFYCVANQGGVRMGRLPP